MKMNTETRPIICTTLYRKPIQPCNFDGIHVLYLLCLPVHTITVLPPISLLPHNHINTPHTSPARQGSFLALALVAWMGLIASSSTANYLRWLGPRHSLFLALSSLIRLFSSFFALFFSLVDILFFFLRDLLSSSSESLDDDESRDNSLSLDECSLLFFELFNLDLSIALPSSFFVSSHISDSSVSSLLLIFDYSPTCTSSTTISISFSHILSR